MKKKKELEMSVEEKRAKNNWYKVILPGQDSENGGQKHRGTMGNIYKHRGTMGKVYKHRGIMGNICKTLFKGGKIKTPLKIMY